MKYYVPFGDVSFLSFYIIAQADVHHTAIANNNTNSDSYLLQDTHSLSLL